MVREGFSDKVTFVLRPEDEKKPGQCRVGGKRLLSKDTAQANSD